MTDVRNHANLVRDQIGLIVERLDSLQEQTRRLGDGLAEMSGTCWSTATP